VRTLEHDVSLEAWFSISVYLINQTLGGPLVRALRARAGNEFSTEGLRAYGRCFGTNLMF